jgi:hypothetical protein
MRLMLSLSEFYSARALRISHMVGSSLSEEFAVKSLLRSKPFTFMITVALLFLIVLSTATKIIEGPVYAKLVSDGQDPGTLKDFRSWSNCFWYVLVTMTTVGYGDYTAKTNLGRVLSIINAVLGNLILSLLILSLQNSLDFIRNEEKAYLDITEQMFLQDLEKESANLFSISYKYSKIKNKVKELLKEQLLLNKKGLMGYSSISKTLNLNKKKISEKNLKKRENININISSQNEENHIPEMFSYYNELKVNISNLKSQLVDLLYKKIIQEKKFFNKLKEYRNNFGYLTEDKVFKVQVSQLHTFRETIEEKTHNMEFHVNDISTTLNLIEKVLQNKIEEKEKNGHFVNAGGLSDVTLSKYNSKLEKLKLNQETYDNSLLKCEIEESINEENNCENDSKGSQENNCFV